MYCQKYLHLKTFWRPTTLSLNMGVILHLFSAAGWCLQSLGRQFTEEKYLKILRPHGQELLASGSFHFVWNYGWLARLVLVFFLSYHCHHCPCSSSRCCCSCCSCCCCCCCCCCCFFSPLLLFLVVSVSKPFNGSWSMVILFESSSRCFPFGFCFFQKKLNDTDTIWDGMIMGFIFIRQAPAPSYIMKIFRLWNPPAKNVFFYVQHLSQESVHRFFLGLV